MFNLAHILYIAISAVITIALLILASICAKSLKAKRVVLILAAVTTVALHFSPLYVAFLKTGSATVASPMLFPIYPCNVIMWLLVICAFTKGNNENKTLNAIYEFVFWAGTVCGIIGIVLNENFAANPTLADWDILHGLLSHSTMVFGCLYLLVGKFIKIRVSNCFSVFLGLCLFLVDGAIINNIYKRHNLGNRNSMYLQTPPFDNAPWFNVYLMGVIGITVVFIITALYEQIALKKQDRWYSKIRKHFGK